MKHLKHFNESQVLNGLMAQHALNGGNKSPFNDDDKKFIQVITEKASDDWDIEVGPNNLLGDNSFTLIQKHDKEDIKSLSKSPLAIRVWKFEGYFLRVNTNLEPIGHGGEILINYDYKDWGRKWYKYNTDNLRDVFNSDK